MKGIITHTQRMSLHDGPGIRNTIFFKGCNLRCAWCHNPETLSLQPELGWAENKCIHCGVCEEKCPQRALSVQGNGIVKKKEACTQCGTCVNECYANAHYLIGKEYTEDELCRMMEQDRDIFQRSGGGVTLSGGEPMVQHKFLLVLAQALHAQGLHVTLQTNLYASWNLYETILPYIDYLMCDLKHLDSEEHRRWTGQGNKTILANLHQLDATGKKYIVRTPVIPGVNNKEEQLRDISHFVSQLHNTEGYVLLPFHPLAAYKYHNMGIEYEFETIDEIPHEEFATLKEQFELR